MKARDGDRAQSLALCEALGADDRGELIQRDTYFNVATGRLKLREERDAATHLITVHSMADIYGEESAQLLADEVWLRDAGENDWIVLTKDDAIRQTKRFVSNRH